MPKTKCRTPLAEHKRYVTRTDPDKTIKLWKVFDKPLNAVTEGSLVTGEDPSAMLMSSQTMSTEKSNGSLHPSLLKLGASGGSTSSPTLSAAQSRLLRLPRLAYHDTIIAAVPRKIYANAHAYHINSLSVNSDGETYISADDLRINLWNLGISDKSFSRSLLNLPRHCRHQTCQYGGTHGGDHCSTIPPHSLQ